MNILEYVKKFFSSFKKNEIRERIRTIKFALSNPLMQTVETLAHDNQYKELEFSSDYGKKFIKAWLNWVPSKVKSDRDQPYLSVLRPAVVNAIALLDYLDEYVHKQLDDVIHIEGITYQKATVLRLIEFVQFFEDYAMRQLTYLVTSETNILAFSHPDGRPFSKNEEEWLQGSNMAAYFRMIELLSANPKDILNNVLRVKDEIVTEESSRPTLGEGNDPLRLNFIPIVGTVAMWVGVYKVNRDAERLDRAQKEERVIKLRLEALRQRNASGQPDARIESNITNFERELTLKRNELAEYTRKMQVTR